MDQSQQRTLADYKEKGFAERSGFGAKPAFLVVDFINGFTDPASPLGGDYPSELSVTADLLAAFRAGGHPVLFTTVVYNADLRDAGVFIKKVPSLKVLVRGSKYCDVDDRIRPVVGESVLEKKFASGFFGTDLDTRLRGLGVDTVVIVGATTSGCIRASAIDSMQHGFRTIVVRDAVGDRAPGPHEANLFDIDAKYGDVIDSHEVLSYLRALSTGGGSAGQAGADFQRWWNREGSVVA